MQVPVLNYIIVIIIVQVIILSFIEINIFTSGTCVADIPVNIEVRLVELTCFVGHFVDENYTEGILD